MNRREFLKDLGALGAGLAASSLVIATASKLEIGASEQLSPIERRLETIDKQTWKPLRSIWSHPTLGLVELLKTYPGASNARVITLASTELHDGGFSAKGNVYYVPRDKIKFAYSIPRDNYQLPS